MIHNTVARGWRVLSRGLPSSPKLYTLRGVSAVYDGCNVNPEITDYSSWRYSFGPGKRGLYAAMRILNRTNTSGCALSLRAEPIPRLH